MTITARVIETTANLHLWNHTGMALHTAFGFMLLGGGLLAVIHGDATPTWSLNSGTTVGILLGVALLMAMAVVSNDFTYRLQSDDSSVSHTNEAIKMIEAIDGGMTDLESGQRGFLITGSDALLERRAAGEDLVRKELAAVRNLTSDNQRSSVAPQHWLR